MLFNSGVFLVFFLVFFFLYWFVTTTRKSRNILILLGSYLFYGWWDWRFVSLLLLSTVIDYCFGLAIHQSPQKRKKLYLWLSVVNNLGILAFFKYFNFFSDSFAGLFSTLGLGTYSYTLEILLPVGISFYTFHGMSYVFDIYYGRVTPTRSFVDYAVFVSFFPLLVAGPIERANHLLPQVVRPRTFNFTQGVAGMQILLWGLFKKVVIADGVAHAVDDIFRTYDQLPPVTLAIGVVLFAVQIYCDFSGYSDMAIGLAKLLGFELLVNFRFPYFSRDIAEFWRRWHISLSSWFRDYLYIPLGGSRSGVAQSIRNTFIIFMVSGFWHGANWTFIVWGFLHALYFLPLMLLGKNRAHLEVVAGDRTLPSLKEIVQMVTTFSLVCVAWVFFRAESLGHAFGYLGQMLRPDLSPGTAPLPLYMLVLIIATFVVEWFARRSDITYVFSLLEYRPLRYATYYFLLMVLILYGTFSQTKFIYFQF